MASSKRLQAGLKLAAATDRPAQEFRPDDRIDHAGLVGTVERVAVTATPAGCRVQITACPDGKPGVLQVLDVDGAAMIGRPFGTW